MSLFDRWMSNLGVSKSTLNNRETPVHLSKISSTSHASDNDKNNYVPSPKPSAPSQKSFNSVSSRPSIQFPQIQPSQESRMVRGGPCDYRRRTLLLSEVNHRGSGDNSHGDSDSAAFFRHPFERTRLLVDDRPLNGGDSRKVRSNGRFFQQGPLSVEQIRNLFWVEEISPADHYVQTARSLNLFRQRKRHCDVRLTTDTGRLYAHKTVLVTFSHDLQNRLEASSLWKSGKMSVDLCDRGFEDTAMDLVIEWMYTGSIRCTIRDNLDRLLTVAEGLRISRLTKICQKLSNNYPLSRNTHMDVATVLHAVPQLPAQNSLLASFHSRSMNSEIHVRPSFSNIISTEEFLRRPIERITSFLSSDTLVVGSELDVYKAALRWLNQIKLSRMVHLDRLMSCIRWIHMTPEDIVLVKHIDPVLFAEPAVSNKAALGQWQRDLLRRGISFASADLPSNRCQNYTGLITIWPEWTEQDLLTEKWDVQAAGAGTKSAKDPKVKGASFEDPEGRTRLPHSLLRVLKDWKRPQELFGENLCIVRNTIRINLKEPNAHILHSEFIRHYLSHVTLLWYLAQRKKFSLKNHPVISVAPPPPPAPATEMTSKTSVGSHKGSKHTIGKDTSASKTSQGAESPVKCLCFEDPLIDWAPWNFIYGGPPSAPRAANVKGEVAYVVSNLPQYNPNGKYAVKLFWMGAWRKVVVDDYIPVDEHNRPLLPVCNEPNELWPLILTKAVMKVVSLDYGGNTGSSEMGDAGFVLHVLTGYTPHVIYLGHPKSTRKAIWNKLQALLPLNKKPPPEDVLSALSENWDIRNCAALRTWTAQSDPAYLQKVDTIRANRLQTAAAPAPSPGLATQSVTSSTLGAANTLAPKPLVRSASARNSSNAPRKLELSSPNNALTLSLSVPSDLPRIKNPKTPEVLIYASYRSAHHEPGMFDQEEHSRSANLYDSGFLRAESHPILLRNIRDVPPKLPTRSPVPRYKLFRPLRINPDRYSQIILRDHRRREHSIRSIDFLSLLWTEKGRLTHQTASRANHLTEEQDPDTQNRVRWKPTDGFKPSLSAIPENCLFPRKKTVRHLSELIFKPPSPPPTPSHEEKASKNKGGEPGKPPANQAVPEPIPLPSLPPPPQSQEEIQKHCRLNRGSIEFNRFFESLESIYIFTKPETFDYQSTFSFYQSNILIDGRPPPTKKKGGDQMSQQIVGGSESSRPNQTKPPSSPNPGRFAKVTVELPSPYLMVDNPYPTCIVLGISTVSRWFFAPKSEVKSQERMSVVAGTIEELKGMERPLPVIVTLKHHDWMFARSEPAILSIKTSSVQGVCYQIPAGRHIFRLKVVCPGRRDLEPHGFCIRSFSRDPVHIGPEDVILKMAAVDSYQYSILARKALLPIVRWWRLNGSPTFTHPPHREIIATLGLEEEAHNKFTRRVFFDAMLAAFYKAMEVYLHEFCTTKGAFTLRVFIGDLTTRNILNLSKAQLAKKDSKNAVSQPVASSKGDSHATPGGRQVEGGGKKTKQKGGELSVGSPSHKGSSGFAIAERESVRDKTVLLKREKPLLGKKVLHKDEAKASTIWAMYFQVAKATNVLQARKSGSKKKEAVLKMAQDMLEALLRNEQPFASCFFRNLCRNLPADWLDLDFFFRHERRYISREIAGNFPDFPANTWKLFLRDTFYVQEPLWIAFRLATTIAAMRLTVVNNDTGRPLPSTLFHNLPHLYEKNTAGYTLVAEAKSGTLGWRGAPWSLRIIQALDPFLHESTQADNLLVKFNTASPMTTFVTKELNDYFLPDLLSNPTLAQVTMTVKHHSTVSICFMTSNSEARFFVQITNKDNCLYKGQGRGILVIPALYLKSSEPPAPEVFSLKAICLDDSWAFSGPEWKYAFTEKSKRISVEYGRESPSTPPSTSPVKGEKPAVKKTTKSSKDREKEDKSDKESVDSFRSKGKDGKDKVLFDTTKPHWLAKFVIDTTDNEFQVVRDLSMDEAVKTELHESIVADPGVLQRGKDFREDYLRKRAGSGFTSPESVDYPGWTTGTPRPVWPAPTAPFPLSFDLANFHRPAAGDAPEELDLFVHQNSMRVLSNRYTEAVQAKEDYLARERTDRDTIIRQQTNMIKVLVDATISERRKYIEQREVKKKQLDDRALEEERLLKPVVVADHHHPKTDEKRKKSKKPV